MHGVRFRQVQERYWIYQLQQLSDELELACAEYGFRRLHLQRWLVGAEWRAMHGVRRWQVQERGRTRWLRRVPASLCLAHSKHCNHTLHLQRRMVWP